ncbi:MAG TPA: lytic transglycosylase domain-containing protein [Solirubrobacteraceae bacterium]|nr:lytic transglycosylase domain-containing protein [Solirubrobacteraceae bacterium]
MSTEPIASQPLAGDAQAAAQRVAQLRALIEQARTGEAATTPATANVQPSFAESLRAAGAVPASTPTTTTGGQAGGEYEALVQQAAVRNGVDPAVLHGLIQQESGFDPSSTSSAGAQGLTQLMPETAASLGVTEPLNPAQSIEGGARYLSQMLAQFGGNTTEALAAYNAGAGAVRQYEGVPPYPETQDYVEKVLAYAQSYRQTHPTAAGGTYPA